MAVDTLHAYPDPPTMPKSPRGQNRIELLQGTLDLLILQSLRWGPQHGYGLSQLIRTHSGERLQVDTGSLYPALHRLERAGVIAADWKMSDNKQRVRVYRLTAAGRKQLVAERSRWDELSQAISGVLNPPGLESEG
jgi:PadR family transcriptional regulator, regulatory protein PadR